MANIRTARRSGLVFRGGRNVRETVWVGSGTVETTLAGAPTAVLINSLNSAALSLRPFTVVRVRGVMHIHSDQAGADETYGAAYGQCVVSDQAVAIGVTAVPTPVTDKSSDLWLAYENLFQHIEVITSASVLNEGAIKYFDSRAMRKVEEGQDLIAVVENEINGVIVTTTARLLFKLH